MPTVPQDRNRVEIEGLPNARSNVNYAPEMFGAGVGRAVQQIGGAVVDYAKQEQQKQDTAALMQAERKLQEWQNQALFAPETGAYAQRGQNAFGLPERMLPAWDKQVGDVEAGLTDRQRQIFRERAGNMRVSMERDLMRHVGSEAETFQKQETTALVATRLDTALLYWNDPARFDKELREAQGVFLAGHDGIPPAAQQVGLREIESRGRAGVISKMLEANDATSAQRYYDTFRDTMVEADRVQTERVLTPARKAAEADQQVAITRGRAVPGGASVTPQGFYDSVAGIVGKEKITEWVRPGSAKYGVSNSAHHTGYGIDIRNRDMSPEESAAVVQKFAALGYVAEDVRTPEQLKRHNATGPHIHVQVPEAMRGDGTTAAAPAGPMQKADALAYLNKIDDPDVRRLALSQYRTELEIENVREAEAEEAFTKRVNLAVEQADPSTPLDRVLSRADYAHAQETGKLEAWENRQKHRIAGTDVDTPPDQLLAYRDVVYRAATGDKAAQAELKKYNPYDPHLQMSMQDRDWLAQNKAAILSGDKAKTAKAATEGEINSVIQSYSERNLGLEKDDKGKLVDPNGEAWKFNEGLRLWANRFEEVTGKPPTYTDITKQADLMTLDRLKFTIETPRAWGLWTGEDEKTVADLGMNDETKVEIVNLLRSHGQPVTGRNVAAVYQNMLKAKQ